MKIWKLENDFRKYESFRVTNEDSKSLEAFKNKMLSGESQNGELDYIEVELVDGTQVSDLIKLWNYSSAILFSERAKLCLEGLINDCIEFIPVKYETKTMYLVNILCIVDAIDYDKSELRTLESGLVVGFNRYSFIHEKIKGLNMFKVMLNDRIYSTEVFVTLEFKRNVEENNLLGFKFKEVWNSNLFNK